MKGVWSWPFPFNKAKSFPPWQIAKTAQKLKWTLEIQNWRHAGSRLSRLPFREMLKKRCRYAELIRLCITTNWQCLRWAVSVSRALPPCCENRWRNSRVNMIVGIVKFLKRRKNHGKRERRQVEVLHLFRCSTHTRHCHTQLLSCTISFLFPAFPISFSHLLGDYWKKLTCGVFRSFDVL